MLGKNPCPEICTITPWKETQGLLFCNNKKLLRKPKHCHGLVEGIKVCDVSQTEKDKYHL